VSGDPLKQLWCCLSCGEKFAFGKLRTGGGVGEPIAGNDHGLNCPHCRGMKIHPADGTVVTSDYHGERGPLQ
jgi:DNA-directed RNA polymerase subunit RPC12/RpoP